MIHTIGPFAPYDSNIYLLTGETNVIIDTGTGVFAEMVVETVKELIGDGKLEKILLTHCHVDHIGGVKSLVEAFGSEVYAGYKDAAPMREGDSRYTLDGMFKLRVEPFDVKDLHDGDVIDTGSYKLRVIETPGHTSGGVCFYDESSCSLFSGDTVFENGVGRTDFPGGSNEDLRNSIKYISNIDVKGLYPGHGPGTMDGRSTIERVLKIIGD